ncbi:MAG: alpha-ketoglutarate-dependent dioxygenase AlkB [Frankiaceae bacterium]
MPDWLATAQQQHLVQAFRTWSTGPVPIRAASMRGGSRMSVQTVCLGWHWQPYRYTRAATDVNGRQVLALPGWLAELGRGAVADAYGSAAAAAYRPDTALVNFYDTTARLGMHQDKDETVDEPVVSLSIGDTCRFRFGNPDSRGRPYIDIDLVSGDAFVFGRQSRFAYHGVPKIYPDTASPVVGLQSGRINITLRVTGLDQDRDTQKAPALEVPPRS